MTSNLLRNLLTHCEELEQKYLDDAYVHSQCGCYDSAARSRRDARGIEWDIKQARRELLKMEGKTK